MNQGRSLEATLSTPHPWRMDGLKAAILTAALLSKQTDPALSSRFLGLTYLQTSLGEFHELDEYFYIILIDMSKIFFDLDGIITDILNQRYGNVAMDPKCICTYKQANTFQRDKCTHTYACACVTGHFIKNSVTNCVMENTLFLRYI